LRERAQCISIKTLVAKFETAPAGEWKKYAWMLERFFRTQFSDPTRIGFQVNQQFNNGNGDGLVWTQEKLDEARQRLEHTRALQKKREVGAQTNAELREIMLEQIAERQRVLDYLDGGGTLDQDEQKQLYDRLEHESDSRQQEPIRTATGRVVGEAGPMAIEDQSRLEPAPGRPQRPQPSPQDHSMRASDMDPLSGVTMPTEPPTPWRDRKPLAGPLSTRQRWLAEERVRKGGEGKRPW
jgi:hypothetical protein